MASRRTSGSGPTVAADAAPGASPDAAIAVHTLTTAAKDLIEGAFPPLWVRGEVTNFKAHRNGHWYFSLRDAEAQVNCVIWSSAARRLPAPPDEGMQVLAFGQMTVWPVRGDLQFSVRQLEAEGDGLWRKALERTRLRLERDGLLDPARKRPLPVFPRRIAVITSPDGAALHDIVSVSRARSADVELVIVPAKVQGEGAPDSLVAAIDQCARWGDADLLIIGRGGGSREDLWAFNDERVARALAASPIPTISAVGHEVDISMCDLVADVRAATPSAAAELAVPSRREITARVAALGKRLAAAARRREDRAVAALAQVRKRLGLAATRLVERRRARVETVAGQLHALSPLTTLARGFAVARTPEGATLSGSRQFVAGAPFALWLHDGIVDAVAGVRRPLPAGFAAPADASIDEERA
ncbi:MAG: exodeoxyribonuclease VII large subunit [Gemmatimonas sp.]|jgi:exodeoxyribonuclease VII large subunit|uniref:exodeoxyribonuclease VII large subunit n=1 Tax=Gemmatimonas sp. TaxID=1962908 RepID=UPI00391F0450|nr:exodeoxyribonuclease VII large subunit [Gemmatimonadota bacterium]